ncbi:hypothetical protein K505DRAFT_328248 [Melanomma pulvis-pyrius CBS 109.77]|uniref:Uncharacterized protein n=1 Tax=Melanomma pulvis-pyrius CBS 109.77 TaxID=1314802 RepID=A0A6A6WZW4_9PLEO|nr:hypothetical protein K505DRAFT_328248 [Melanomma pulvis-pyrius CBS 109.77]
MFSKGSTSSNSHESSPPVLLADARTKDTSTSTLRKRAGDQERAQRAAEERDVRGDVAQTRLQRTTANKPNYVKRAVRMRNRTKEGAKKKVELQPTAQFDADESTQHRHCN